MADTQDRNVPASHRRIAKAREDGQVARSRDLAHLLPMAAAAAALVVLAPLATHAAGQLLSAGLRFDANALATPQAMLQSLSQQAQSLLAVLLPLGVGMVVAAAAAAVLAGGWNFSWKALAPKFSKLDPLSGLGRMFSKAHLGDTLKASLLVLVLAVVGGFVLSRSLARFHDALVLLLGLVDRVEHLLGRRRCLVGDVVQAAARIGQAVGGRLQLGHHAELRQRVVQLARDQPELVEHLGRGACGRLRCQRGKVVHLHVVVL